MIVEEVHEGFRQFYGFMCVVVSTKDVENIFEKVSSRAEVPSKRNSSIKHKITLVISQSFSGGFSRVLRFHHSKFFPLSPFRLLLRK
jgi:hypothetical protein